MGRRCGASGEVKRGCLSRDVAHVAFLVQLFDALVALQIRFGAEGDGPPMQSHDQGSGTELKGC